MTTGDMRAGRTQGTDPTPAPSSTRVASDSHKNAALAEDPNTSGEPSEVLSNEEIRSRVDALKALVVDEAACKEGRFLHTVESTS